MVKKQTRFDKLAAKLQKPKKEEAPIFTVRPGAKLDLTLSPEEKHELDRIFELKKLALKNPRRWGAQVS
jgi:hypothetical protein